MRLRIAALAAAGALAVLSCTGTGAPPTPGGMTIVVTYSVLGATVRDLVGDAATVHVLMPNGADPHEWEPSAKDIETLTKADLVVENGLGLEAALANALDQAGAAGVRRFAASDHVTIRRVGPDEGANPGDPDQAPGAEDPHLWLDPLTVSDAMDALATLLATGFGLDVRARARDLDARLSSLDSEVSAILAVIPEARRTLVTGHESLGYLAQRHGLRLVGAIIPSITTSAEPSAADLAALAEKIRAAGVPAIFTELGTSPAVAEAVAKETGAKVVEITTHGLPEDGSYATFMKNIATVIADNLR